MAFAEVVVAETGTNGAGTAAPEAAAKPAPEAAPEAADAAGVETKDRIEY